MVKKTQSGQSTVDAYAVQCAECQKWRVLPSIHEFEEVRCKVTEDPFVCNKRPNRSCEDPTDIEYDSSRTWVMDKPNIPKTPSGFFRELVLRRDYSKMDAFYITPEGKKLRSSHEVAAFLEENPSYKESVSLSDFSFTTPKVMIETVPRSVGKKSPTPTPIKKKISKNGGKNLSGSK